MELFAQHRVVWRRALGLVALCVALAMLVTSDSLHAALLQLLEASKDVIARHPGPGALLFVLMAAVSAMFAFLSIAVLVPVAVYAWGTPVSMLLVWIGWILGGATAYGIARCFGRPVVHWLTGEAMLDRIERRIHPQTPFGVIILLQLGLPSEIPGYVLGLVRYPFSRYLLALAIAEVPYTIATVCLGAGIVEAKSGLVLVVGLGAAVLGVGAFYRMRRRLQASVKD